MISENILKKQSDIIDTFGQAKLLKLTAQDVTVNTVLGRTEQNEVGGCYWGLNISSLWKKHQTKYEWHGDICV